MGRCRASRHPLPYSAIEGGRITIDRHPAFPRWTSRCCRSVRIGDRPRARSSTPLADTRLIAIVPPGITRRQDAADVQRSLTERTASRGQRRLTFVDVAAPVRHRTPSGGQPGLRRRRQPLRDLQRLARRDGAGTSIFRVRRQRHAQETVFLRHREPDVDGDRSRRTAVCLEPFRKGTVYHVNGDGTDSAEPFARDLGVACTGLAFDRRRRRCYVGDRSGTIFRRASIARGAGDQSFATLPASVAAFHLAMGPDRALYVTGADRCPRTIRCIASALDGGVQLARRARPASAVRRV